MKMIPLSLILSTCLFATNINFKEAEQDIQRADPTSNKEFVFSYHDAIKEAKKSVVNISTSKTITRNSPSLDDFFNDPYFRHFFGFPDQRGGQGNKEIVSSLGSGVIISNDGYIITNNHVIENTDSIIVNLPDDDTEYKAKIIGNDPKTDLAVIKIEAKNLSSISFADSNQLLEGDVVFAIGNPFGVGSSITSGIVSALNKDNIGLNQYENFIQTDASINPGNSGGALVDSRGALVGINSAILSRSGGNNGIGFAIPSNMAKNIAKRLIEKGKIERGFLGVTITSLQGDTKKAYKNEQGALITNVEKGSSADSAGLKRGDLILKINDKNIKNSNDLKNYIGSLEPGQNIVVIYERDGVSKSVSFVLKGDQEVVSSAGLIDGLELKDLDSNLKSKLPNDIHGVLVSGVKENTKAAQSGFEVGDIIIAVEQNEIKDLQHLSEILKQSRTKNFTKIWVYRKGYAQLLILK
ncbi:serine protease [Campylobacter sp. MIT 99-7217]|uniref:DegQ family serine endoprotease n=1 Tax=Campylobacter sp. MIT 99-7217 TaxID=535091 RepID=UPI00115A8EED|nr:DegQ family serine endoprotease [Campylobacter sp. MIT 99-7217]TQR32973.1 serine protease [Campylobacter sp. MIT 99-7217]